MISRRRLPGLPLLAALLLLAPAARAAEHPKPRLAVLVVIDQLRGDYPTRWNDLFDADGFRRLQRDGAWFQNCHYPYAGTFTGPGHAAIVTGTCPDVHGVIDNEWYDRAAASWVNCVSDDRYDRVPPPSNEAAALKKYAGVSPRRLLAPTLADALKEATRDEGKVVALSFKDRGAVLPGGRRPDACCWFDADDGLFVTSTWYRGRLPAWAHDFNRSEAVERWFGKEWTKLRPHLDYARYSGPDDAPGEAKGYAQGVTFPHPFDGGPKKDPVIYHKALYNSPFGNELLLELAKKAIDAEALGADDVPDLLCLSFSSNDPIGHQWGPDSQEVLDVTLRTDLVLKELLAHLDDRVGKGRYTLALTADHGVCPLPETIRVQGREAARLSPSLLAARANDHLVETLGGDERTYWVEAAEYPWVYLDREVARARGVDPAKVARVLTAWLRDDPAIRAAYTREQMLDGLPADDLLGARLVRSFHPERAGDVGVIARPYHFFTAYLDGTTHGSPYPYDTHVPLLVYGPGVRPGKRGVRVTPLATAAILARALGIAPPARAEEAVPHGLFEK
jgi:predicted AlkP superfamily pyrophosphatase or phosphodiesterase